MKKLFIISLCLSSFLFALDKQNEIKPPLKGGPTQLDFDSMKTKMLQLSELEIKISNDLKKCVESSKNQEYLSSCKKERRLAISKIRSEKEGGDLQKIDKERLQKRLEESKTLIRN